MYVYNSFGEDMYIRVHVYIHTYTHTHTYIYAYMCTHILSTQDLSQSESDTCDASVAV